MPRFRRWLRLGLYLGLAAFVLGGGLTNVGTFYLDRVESVAREYLQGYCEPVFRRAVLGGDAGVIGAAAVARRSLT